MKKRLVKKCEKFEELFSFSELRPYMDKIQSSEHITIYYIEHSTHSIPLINVAIYSNGYMEIQFDNKFEWPTTIKKVLKQVEFLASACCD